MAVVEDLIVAMGFDNKQFEAAVKVSMFTLSSLKSSLNFGGAKNGIDQAAESAAKFNMNNMGTATEGVSAKFIAMSTVAITALNNIVNKAVDAGLNVAKAFTVAPVAQGFEEYETKIGSIQTILSNTAQDYGGNEEAALADITKNLEELNTYADLTIYNFADMTKNIGLFTNAGIGVESATKMIKGFSNEAAASGTSAEKAAGAAQQLSQGLSTGVVTAQDWISLTTAGMGSTNMKDGIVQIAEAMGAFEGTTITAAEAQKDFKGSLEKKWLTADVMENYLNIQAEGEESVNRAMMEQIGLSKEQQDAFIARQAMSQDAAQEVRTFTQLMGTLKEGVGSSWAKTTEILLGDFTSATTLFSGIYNTLSPMIGSFGDSRNALLESWAEMGGRDSLLAGLKNVFEGLMSVIRPIGEAFRQIFPPTTAASLLSMTQAFERFSQKLILGSETADKVKRTFAGVFAVFGIVWEVVKGLATGVAQLFGAFQGGSGGILNITARIGDFVVKVHEAIKNGEIFKNIFTVLGTVLSAPIALLGNLGTAIGEIIGGIGPATGAVQQFMDILFKGDFTGGPLAEDSPIVDTLFDIREGFVNTFSAIEQFWNILAKGDFIGGVFEEDSPIVDFLFNIRESITQFFSSDSLKLLLAGGAGIGLGVAIKKMIQSAFKFGSKDTESFFGKIKSTFGSARDMFDGVSGLLDGVTNSFKAMQQNLQAGTLLKIGAAIGIVALSLKLLSTIDPAALAFALGGVAAAMGTLLVAMAILTKISGSGAFATIPALAVAMVALSVAVLILSVAVKSLAELEWDELLRGLAGLAGIMLLVVGAAYGLSKAEGPLVRAGLAMIPFAAAVRILVGAVKDLSEMQWDELGRGLAGLAGILVAVAGALKLMPANMVAIGVGLLAVSGAMMLFAQSIEKLGEMDTATLVQGVIGVASALGLIAGAMKLMPANMPAIAAGLLLVSVALVGITASIAALGGMSLESMAQGIIGLSVAIYAIAGALVLMTGTLSGSAALGIAAIGLALLLPSIVSLSLLSWEQLLIGLTGLGAGLAILGVAGLLLTPVVPTLIGLGIALGLMGVGMMAAGVGASLLGAGLSALIGVVMLGQTAIVQLVQIIPQMAAAFAGALIAFLTTLAEKGAELAAAVAKLVGELLDAFVTLIPKVKNVITELLGALVEIIVTNAPKIGEAVTALITTFLQVLETNVPAIINTVFNLMMAFLQTLRDRIPDVVTVVTDIIVAFIGALQQNLPRIVQAGFEFIIGFMNSLADSIRANLPLVGEAAGNIASAIIDGIINGIAAGAGRVFQSLKDLASNALDAAKGVLGINSPSKEFYKIGEWTTEGMVNGIEAGKGNVVTAGQSLAQNLLGSVDDELGKLGGTAKTVFDILAFGDYTNNGGLFDEDSPAVDMLFNLREGFNGLGGAAAEALGILGAGDFKGVGPWDEDSPIVDTLFNLREGFTNVGGAAGEAWNILGMGDFRGEGPWSEDSPIVDTLFDIREGFTGIGESAGQAWGILNEGDFKGSGPWSEDSPIVDTLFDIREGFEQFNGVGEDAIQGLINGFNAGTIDIVAAAQNMATSALDAARATLGIQSPSKEFQNIGEYSIEGLIIGLNSGGPAVGKEGNKVANSLVAGFSKGLGKEMPKAFASIFETLRTGTADVKFWGPNNPATIQLQNMNKALQEAELRLAAFYGEVNLADPASIEAYVEKTGNSLKYLTGLLNGMEKAANTAFEMLESGKGLDVVLGDEAVLNNLLDGILSVIPGVEAMLFRLGLAVVDGFLGIFFDTSVMGIVGDFITFAIRQIGALFGIEFPIEEELDDANKELEDFLVNVEDTQGRFDKLTKAGIASLTTTLTEANEAVDALDHNPTITPVLDLTEYNKQKAGMGSDAPIAGFTPEASAFQAQSLYDERKEFEAIQAAEQNAKTGTEHKFGNISFVQTNNSPIPLGHVDIYKATKGLLSNAKEALNIS